MLSALVGLGWAQAHGVAAWLAPGSPVKLAEAMTANCGNRRGFGPPLFCREAPRHCETRHSEAAIGEAPVANRHGASRSLSR